MDDPNNPNTAPATSNIDQELLALAKDTQKVATSVVERLKAYKEAHQGIERHTLPQSGVEVTFPEFRSHGGMMKAQRLAKGDAAKATRIYAVNICKFDGEKITLEDFDLFTLTDSNKILELLFGDEADSVDDEDGEPKVPQH